MSERGPSPLSGHMSERSNGWEHLTYEQLLSELETMTDRMASGDLGIEEAADLYERATELHAAATARLEAIKARIGGLADTPQSRHGDR
jgi:exodeoxyribonuclease VII small subunit